MHNTVVEMIGTEVAVASSNRDYELIDFRQLDVAALLGWHLEATAWLHSWNFARHDWMDEILLGWTFAFAVVLSCRDSQQLSVMVVEEQLSLYYLAEEVQLHLWIDMMPAAVDARFAEGSLDSSAVYSVDWLTAIGLHSDWWMRQ